MNHLRAILRLVALVLWTLILAVVHFALRISIVFSERVALLFQCFCFRQWARGAALIMGMRVRVDGSPPRAPFILVSNHLSYMDIVLLATQVDAVFVSKSEVAAWPVIGPLARSMNTIFVDRTSRTDVPRVLDLMEHVIRAGHGVVFFPEGTSSEGKDVLHFKSSLFDAPIRLGCPVHAAALSYRTPNGWPPASVSVCWWGDMTFADHVYRLLQLPFFVGHVTFGEGVPTHPDRRSFADATREAVKRGFTPVPAQRGMG
jgi:1-acyl-sn-glycerol-3-phosphate acyltransferase